MLRAPSGVRRLQIAKLQIIRCVASSLKVLWYGSMKWNMEKIFSTQWKIFSMEWNWNARKFSVWNMKKSFSIAYHALGLSDFDEKYCSPMAKSLAESHSS